MTRTTLAAAMLTSALSGCILYETREIEEDCRGRDCPAETTDDPSVSFPSWTDDSTDPAVASDVFLTVTEGAPGETLLTTLEATGDFDLLQVVDIAFAGPVDVVDRSDRDDELLLIIRIDDGAKPGRVDVFVTWGEDDVARLSTPFTIVPHAVEDTGEAVDTSAPADTGMPADTGAGAPHPDPDDTEGDTSDTGITNCP
ncbi:MAG: hypothetical protein ACI8PZ_006410 [Myxococcota bacterium]|jgi:hypothetical protein